MDAAFFVQRSENGSKPLPWDGEASINIHGEIKTSRIGCVDTKSMEEIESYFICIVHCLCQISRRQITTTYLVEYYYGSCSVLL